jgi:hypothetical protein
LPPKIEGQIGTKEHGRWGRDTNLGGELLARGLAAGRLAGGLLRTGHVLGRRLTRLEGAVRYARIVIGVVGAVGWGCLYRERGA